jgi:nicotinamidase-related amidase
MPDALIVVDMLSTYDHPDGERLAEAVRDALPAMQAAIATAREEQRLIVYVNDSYGRWTGERRALADWVLDSGQFPDLVRPILPEDEDLFIPKARHSIFFETPLAYILNSEDLDAITLIGQVTEQCILYSALDAHVRHLGVRVATDAVASIDDELGRAALRMMKRNMGAELVEALGAHAAQARAR